MKILIFTETYLPTNNGVVSSIEIFRTELEKRGHTVYIVAPHHDGEKFHDRSHVFRLMTFPLVGKPTHPVSIPYKSQVEAIIAEVQPDIIHVQGMFSTGYLGRKAAHNHKIPLILTYHTLLEGYAHYSGIFSGIAAPLLKWWSKQVANNVDLVITPTPSMAKVLKTYGVKTDIVALPTGIDIKDYKPQDKQKSRKELGLDSETIYILSAARLSQEKNIEQLLIDFGRVHVRYPHVHLLLASDGPDRAAYEKIVQDRGLTENVTFLGIIPHEQLARYFEASDIFAFPSLTDTQGIVLLEAMAVGIPSVVYNILGPGDLIKHEENGLKAAVGTDQFFQNLHALVQHKELREKLSFGAQREVRKYTIEKTTDQLEQLYQVMMDHNKK